MAFDHQANEDFRRAIRKALWRRLGNWFNRENNELLPFYDVRKRLPIKGQSYLGLQSVPVNKIIGSTGRYRDFDRAFLPRQNKTRSRWISIDKAHYEQVPLPPIELYKIGDAYFVKDGNHRVSVAREQGQLEIDAEVIEIRVPVPVPADLKISDLDQIQEHADFLELTKLLEVRPEANIDFTLPGAYDRLLEHINVHRWFLGELRGEYVSIPEAAESWYDRVYTPMVEAIASRGIVEEFPDRTEADLFLWINEYLWYRLEAYKRQYSVEEAASLFISDKTEWPGKKLMRVLRDATWLDHLIIEQEKIAFYERTQLGTMRPDARIEPTLPGRYDHILDHIDVHRWFMGEEKGEDIPYKEAVASWYDNVYIPIVAIIRDQHILADFPGRSETDLYLWILNNRQHFLNENGTE